MNLFWKISNQNGGFAELRIKDASDELGRFIVRRMEALQVDRAISDVPEFKSSPVVEKTHQEVREDNATVKTVTVESRPKQLPYVNGPNSLSQNVGEKLKEALQKQVGSGTREVGGVMLYQTGYSCPSCNHTGIRYMQETCDFCKCHECKTEIRMHNATPEGLPSRDEKGNYFIAETPWN
ncbi:hypothetical protein [Brevibacillus laterosporus]|uniref:Uncharacterized protein n=1 Tax=Brevibacillus laterosporus TaxID=1465 RepID=A0AAP3G6R4_BRELA|nr:hypothetical protein [Brevibacillus laterosporus]MCR8979503.1 hypothetical protein [Brevibacillus laterosporus]MCZ0806658.1 hypothetical protein [Brevibacillus laterosporus]MCZ0825106.1 hypothetical protein [Brevibacillus laterosporus]MCZ0852056.1 hypothetical protein [Brevibacillus laterosporus]